MRLSFRQFNLLIAIPNGLTLKNVYLCYILERLANFRVGKTQDNSPISFFGCRRNLEEINRQLSTPRLSIPNLHSVQETGTICRVHLIARVQKERPTCILVNRKEAWLRLKTLYSSIVFAQRVRHTLRLFSIHFTFLQN